MYYVRIRGKVFGPLEDKQVLDMVRLGQLGRMNEISTDQHQWVRADEFEQFFPKHQPKRKPPHLGEFELPKEDSPGETQKPDSESSAVAWYYSDDGKTGMGPFPQSDIEQMIGQDKITGQTILWHDQLDPQTAETVPEFARLFRKSSQSAGKRNRNASKHHQTSDGTSARQGTVAPEVLEQLEKAATWSFVLVLMVTIGAAMLLILQLFLFVFIAQSGSVPSTLGFLLVSLVIDLVCGYMIFALWRYTNQLKRALRAADDISLALAAKRMAEFWRASVISPIVLCVFLLLVTLLAFTVGLNSLKAPFHEILHEIQSFPMEMPVDLPIETSSEQ